ncbi:MAG: 4Fe-4S binding protein [bacterium]|nr:4Fe-4S binding protein [bacterium]
MKNTQNNREEMLSDISGEFTMEILVNPGKCDGCAGSFDCIASCKEEMTKIYPDIEPNSRISIYQKDGAFFPSLCRNCEESSCMSACMSGARVRNKDNGWVETNYSLCVGCWMCIMSCPYGVIARAEKDHLALKCDGCSHTDVPPCVKACKPKAIEITGTYRYSQKKRKIFAKGYF